jgi:hypothetical protein
LICTAAAVSSTVTFGSWTILRFELPQAVQVAAQSLRVSGRLFWPAHYLLVLAALSLTFWIWKPSYRLFILGLALAIQFADLRTLRGLVRTNVDAPVENRLHSPVWRSLGVDLANLLVIPAYQCGPFAAPGGKPTYAIFGKLASSQRMRTNSYYAARYTKRELQVHCLELPDSLLRGKVLDAHTAYVVSDGVRAVWESTPVTSHRCDRVDGFNLCLPLKAESATRVVTPPEPAPYAIGEILDFTAKGNARKYMTYGWAVASGEDGTWTEGPVARIRLGLSSPVEGPLSIVLMEGSRPFVTRLHPRLDVEVLINSRPVDRWSFEYGSGGGNERRTVVPESVLAGQRQLDVDFRVLNPEAPANVGEGPDDRLLGLNVRALLLQRKP